jgi:hypothetical protein
VYLCVLYGSHNKQRLLPYRALPDWFLITQRESVYCAVRTGSLNVIQVNPCLKRLILLNTGFVRPILRLLRFYCIKIITSQCAKLRQVYLSEWSQPVLAVEALGSRQFKYGTVQRYWHWGRDLMLFHTQSAARGSNACYSHIRKLPHIF